MIIDQLQILQLAACIAGIRNNASGEEQLFRIPLAFQLQKTGFLRQKTDFPLHILIMHAHDFRIRNKRLRILIMKFPIAGPVQNSVFRLRKRFDDRSRELLPQDISILIPDQRKLFGNGHHSCCHSSHAFCTKPRDGQNLLRSAEGLCRIRKNHIRSHLRRTSSLLLLMKLIAVEASDIVIAMRCPEHPLLFARLTSIFLCRNHRKTEQIRALISGLHGKALRHGELLQILRPPDSEIIVFNPENQNVCSAFLVPEHLRVTIVAGKSLDHLSICKLPVFFDQGVSAIRAVCQTDRIGFPFAFL